MRRGTTSLAYALSDNAAPIAGRGNARLNRGLRNCSVYKEGADGSLSGTVICRPANLEDVRIAVRFCKVRLLRTPEYDAAHSVERPKPIEPVQNDQEGGGNDSASRYQSAANCRDQGGFRRHWHGEPSRRHLARA